jgi:predicted phage-related endonuclease
MALTGLEFGYLTALIGGQKFVYHLIERDDELIEQMIEAATEFWYETLEPRIEPPVTERDTELLNQIYSATDPDKVVEFEGNDDAVIVKELMYTAERLDVAKKSNELVKNQIRDRMKDAELLMFQGQKIATWKADKNGKRTFRVLI